MFKYQGRFRPRLSQTGAKPTRNLGGAPKSLQPPRTHTDRHPRALGQPTTPGLAGPGLILAHPRGPDLAPPHSALCWHPPCMAALALPCLIDHHAITFLHVRFRGAGEHCSMHGMDGFEKKTHIFCNPMDFYACPAGPHRPERPRDTAPTVAPRCREQDLSGVAPSDAGLQGPLLGPCQRDARRRMVMLHLLWGARHC